MIQKKLYVYNNVFMMALIYIKFSRCLMINN